ncbi:MAG: hypothetical protein JXA69_16675 [Phycisphaerae bacterium]|nr:hypothetical protein [Phycisphaerae bacterium]
MRTLVTILLLAGLVNVTATGARAQDTPGMAPADILSLMRLASEPYVDPSFGFSLRPFSPCQMMRHKQMVDDGDVELVQFVQRAIHWALFIRISRTPRPMNSDDLLAHLEASLVATNPDVEVLGREKLTAGGRDAVRLAASCTIEGRKWLRQRGAVFFQPDEFFVLSFNTPLEHREKAEAIFADAIRSFEIVRSEMTQDLLRQALDRGAALLRRVADRKAEPKRLVPELYLRCVVDGRDTGFVWLREGDIKQQGIPGTGLLHESWIFEENGMVIRQLNEMFLADDLTFEQWDNRIQTIVPIQGTVPVRTTMDIERGLRQDNRLVVSVSTSPNSEQFQDKVLATPNAYASAAVVALFARLVDLSKPELYAFATYNSERQGFVLRTLRIVGPQNITVDGQAIRAVRIEDSEGLIPPVSEVYVTETGRLVKIVANKLEMIATPKEKVVARYRDKVVAVERDLQELAPPAPNAAPSGQSPPDPRGQGRTP